MSFGNLYVLRLMLIQYRAKNATWALVSVLFPLPFVLSSLVLTSQVTSLDRESLDGNSISNDETTPLTSIRSSSGFLSFLGVCSLTAATLVVIGFIGELRGTDRKEQATRPGASTSSEAFISITSLQRMLKRILSVGLPFYATSKLGGERMAIVILVAIVSGLIPISTKAGEIARPKTWTKMLVSRKWTIVSLGLGCIFDLLNLTNNSLPLQTVSGYLALGVSILLLPWPYPADASHFSATKSFTTPKALKRDSSSAFPQNLETPSFIGYVRPVSPLISTARDTDLTVASGVLATVISFIVFLLSTPQTQTLTINLLLGGSIVAIASTASLLLADPKIGFTRKQISLAAGLAFAIITQEIIDSHPLLPILFQCILSVSSWLGVYLDTSHDHSHHHEHGQSSHGHSHDDAPSRITSSLLRMTEDWPLTHSILLEKDSRRILYFMKYVSISRPRVQAYVL